MKKKLISIIITNYNKSKFLRKSLKSVCDQNFYNYEIILFDDCSDDNSITIIKSFRKIKLIKNLQKKSKSPALNQINGIIKAFKKSKGDIICLMDADDYFKKDKLKKISHTFKKKPEMNCVFNFPKSNIKQFIWKKKEEKNMIWPTIFPTSCISLKKKFLKNFIKFSEKHRFLNLEIDARITIFSWFYNKEYNIIKDKLTQYNFDQNGITATIKKFSFKWWYRRYEAYEYLKIIIKKKKKKFTPSLDYFITNLINMFRKV